MASNSSCMVVDESIRSAAIINHENDGQYVTYTYNVTDHYPNWAFGKHSITVYGIEMNGSDHFNTVSLEIYDSDYYNTIYQATVTSANQGFISYSFTFDVSTSQFTSRTSRTFQIKIDENHIINVVYKISSSSGSFTLGDIGYSNPTGFPFDYLVAGYSKSYAYATFSGISGVSLSSASGSGAYADSSGTFSLSNSLSSNQVYYESGTLKSSSTNYTIQYTCSATDAIGNSYTATKTATVYGYSSPTVSIDTTRCTSTGTTDPLGAYVKIVCTASYTAIGNNSIQTFKINFNGSEVASSKITKSGNTYTCVPLPLATTSQAKIEVTLSDLWETSTISNSASETTLPISMFDNGSQVTVSFGEMATAYSGVSNKPVINITKDMYFRITDSSTSTAKTVNAYDALTKLSSHTNDAGFITSADSCYYATYAGSADSADSADYATSAGSADSATTASELTYVKCSYSYPASVLQATSGALKLMPQSSSNDTYIHGAAIALRVSSRAYIQGYSYPYNLAPISASSYDGSSSKLVKTNIKDMLDEDAKKLLKLNPVSFNYTKPSGMDTEKTNFGVIAEDSMEYIPYAITIPKNYNEEETKEKIENWKEGNMPVDVLSIDYSKIVPQLIKLCQIQQNEIDELKERVTILENK